MKARNLLSVCILLFASIWVNSQDQNYSQFFNNGLYYNPAYAGLYDGVRAYFNYRSQWTNLPYDFKSYNVTTDIAVRNLPGFGGIGLIVHNNNEGEGMIKNLIGGLALTARVNTTNSSSLQFGLTTAICQKKIDYDGLVFPDQLDGKLGNIYPTSFSEPENSSTIYPDFNGGIIFNLNEDKVNFRVGGALHHIFQPKIEFVNTELKMDWKIVGHADAVFYIDKRLGRRDNRDDARINPGFLFENQNGANAFSLGMNGYLSFLYLGLWYRNEDFNSTNLSNVIFLSGINININDDSRIRFMYSYDLILNKLSGTGGNHEISIMFEFKNGNLFGTTNQPKNRKNLYKTMPCETF
jgi:type IX secretion system PorP/SprF family membrane protein